jgi:hypothetical protein
LIRRDRSSRDAEAAPLAIKAVRPPEFPTMHRNASKRVPRRLGVATLVVATFFFASSPTLAQEGGAKIDDARALLEKWVEARRVLSKEARDLELAKETLRAQQELLRREIESLKAKIEEAKKSLADVDKKKEELVLESEALKATTSVLESAVAPAEARARDLAARLPDPLKERLQPVVRRLPAEGEATKLSLSDRFLTIVGLLNETDKFQREVVVRSEVRPLADGTSAEVTAIYPGLGAALRQGLRVDGAKRNRRSREEGRRDPQERSPGRVRPRPGRRPLIRRRP